MTISLKAGWNYEVLYPGITQSTEAALASIAPYVLVIYYYNTLTGLYELPTTMITGNYYWINVSQDCEWTFEMPAVVPCEIAITAPSSAEEGEEVSVSVVVKNVSAYTNTFKTEIYAVPDLYPDYLIGGGQATLFPGDWKFYSASFTMPDCNVTILVWVERRVGADWVYDKSDSKVVSLEVPATYHLDVSVPFGGYVDPGSGDYPANETVVLTAHPLDGYQFTGWGGDASGTSPTYNLYMDSDKYVEAYFEKVPVPEYKGKIIRKELEFSGSGDGTVPVANVPQGVSAKLHVWGRNDMATDQKLGIYWFVADPDGEIAEEYEDWQSWPFSTTPPGETHEFISSGQFDLNKVGKYTTWIELLMNPDDPEMVDLYIGELCTVEAAVPEPEFRGFGVTEYSKT